MPYTRQHVHLNGPNVHVSYVVEDPLPETSTALILSLGLVGIAGYRRL